MRTFERFVYWPQDRGNWANTLRGFRIKIFFLDHADLALSPSDFFPCQYIKSLNKDGIPKIIKMGNHQVRLIRSIV